MGQEAVNTNVVPISEALAQPWFVEAMKQPNLDMIITTMHIDPNDQTEMSEIYNAVRAYYPSLPFIMFTGHRHITYWETYDPNCFTIESGKYFEVIGLVEFDYDPQENNGVMTNIAHQWIDTSRENFYALARKSEKDFLTAAGEKTKEMITYYTNVLHLN